MEISAVGGQAKPEPNNATSFNWWLFTEKTFDDYRNDRITLRQLIISLSRYAERNIPYDWLWAIFEDELNKQFNELGEIAY